MSSSRSSRAKCWRGCGPCCGVCRRYQRPPLAGPSGSDVAVRSRPQSPDGRRRRRGGAPNGRGRRAAARAPRHPGMTVARSRLAELTTGEDRGGRGVDAHIVRLRRKLESDAARPCILVTQAGSGDTLLPGDGLADAQLLHPPVAAAPARRGRAGWRTPRTVSASKPWATISRGRRFAVPGIQDLVEVRVGRQRGAGDNLCCGRL